MTFTITDYSALHKATRTTFPAALDLARRYVSVGGLPATITDEHGCRWVVRAAGWELVSCPAEAGRCECHNVYA